jgi:hypothetical protein
MIQCRTCAAQIPSQANVCPNCGAPVDTQDRPTQNIPISSPDLRRDAAPEVDLPERPTQLIEKDGLAEQKAANPTSSVDGPSVVNDQPPATLAAQATPSRPFTPLSLPQSQSSAHGLMQQGQTSSPGVAAPISPNPTPVAQSPVSTFTPISHPSRTKWKWIFGGLVAVVVLVLAGGALFAYTSAHQSTVVPRIPSGNMLNKHAGNVVTSAQTTTALGKGTVLPAAQAVTTRFTINQTIYVTFKLNLNGINLSKTPLYVNTKFYNGTQSLLSDDPQPVNKAAPGGYSSVIYYVPTQHGAAEIYLCHQRDCSDAQLAQVVHFTVVQPKH